MEREGHRAGFDDGFSLVELTIAMVLFSLIAVGLLPLIAAVTGNSVTNAELVRAKTAVQQKLAELESDYPLDDTVRYGVSTPPAATKNCSLLPETFPREEVIDDGLTVLMSSGSCPSVYPNTVPVHIAVFNKQGKSLASMHTSVRVTQ